MKSIKTSLIALLLFGIQIAPGYTQKILQITDFGGKPDSWSNATPAIKKALDFCRGQENITINFPKGRYDLWPSFCEGKPTDTGLYLNDLKNITIEGNDSELIFHGCMSISLINSCENITFQNFSIDWDRPFLSQAEIVQATDNHLDVWIDKEQYPYHIENGKIMFTGEGWKLPVLGHQNLYDKDKKEIVPQTWDSPLKDIFQQPAEEVGNGVVRFNGKPSMKPDPGTIVTLNHAFYPADGINILQSKNTLLKNLRIYHSLACGVYGELSENITMDNVSVTVNETKGRVFSSLHDASHFRNCKGIIKVENCSHTGQGDDFINVHGCNIVIEDIVDAKTIEVNTRGRYAFAGDEMWFLDQKIAQRGEVRVVESIDPVYNDNKLVGYRISFTGDLPKGTKVKDFVENKTWNASLVLRNCNILKKNRARGILVTTPKDVIIENNYFNTAGTAILIEGDIDHWFESGAVANVKIRNNIFENCLTSGNASGNRWEWGDAVITITPSHKPMDIHTEPYHKNIVIQNNLFKVFDAPLVRGRSVRNLQFIDNEIVKTETYKPYSWQKSAFLLDGCKEVLIRNNQIDEKYITRDILIEHMRKSDVKVDNGQKMKIDFVKGMKTYLN
ncbi:Alpha-1,3-galactosidase B [anaerobic digester metagenome]|jgi:hypothetical protein|uniref:right-handed parallel beta-helix repeat-containing protein n=1 Tax=Petrimonas sp. TaxID=2023866 RepID=UPI002FCA9A15